jgi:hypothetical protein
MTPEELSTEFLTSGSGMMHQHHPSWVRIKSLVTQSDPLTLRITALVTVHPRANLACRRYSVSSSRSSVFTEIIGQLFTMVTAINLEDAGAMRMATSPPPLSASPIADLNLQRSNRYAAALSTAAVRTSATALDGPRGLRRRTLPSVSTPWPMARSRVTWLTWRGRRLTLVR